MKYTFWAVLLAGFAILVGTLAIRTTHSSFADTVAPQPILEPTAPIVEPVKSTTTQPVKTGLFDGVKNVATIKRLINCESGGVNLTRVDSNGRNSDGILQYNRGPENTLKGGTWRFFEGMSGIHGDPMVPRDAILQADWAINHGFGPRWSCF